MAQRAQADESEEPNQVEMLDPGFEHVAQSVPNSLSDDAAANPGLTAVIVLIGIAAAAGAILGAIKGLIKVAVILGLLAAAAWFFYFSR